MLKTMNHINRILAILLSLTLFAAGLAVCGAVVHDLLIRSGAGPGLMARMVANAASQARYLVTARPIPLSGVGGLVALLSAALLWIELKTVASYPQLVLSRGQMGRVAISLNQVSLLAQHEAELVTGVREVRTSSEAKRAGLEVTQTIAVEPEHSLPALAEAIQKRVKHSLEFHLGFPVAAVRIELQQSSLSKALL